jgi:hypothetical protein
MSTLNNHPSPALPATFVPNIDQLIQLCQEQEISQVESQFTPHIIRLESQLAEYGPDVRNLYVCLDELFTKEKEAIQRACILAGLRYGLAFAREQSVNRPELQLTAAA